MSQDGEPKERRKKGLSPELARKVLAMNPGLRTAGKDTFSLMQESQQPVADGTSPQGKTADVHVVFAEMDAAHMKEDLALQQEIARLTSERTEAKRRALDGVIAWLLANDPEIRSPLTQQVLEEHKTFLARVGFSPRVYSDAHKQHRK